MDKKRIPMFAVICSERDHDVIISAATSCVQCTSIDPNGACFKNPPAMTPCNGGIEEQYCTTLHAASLAANGKIADQVVFRGCAADMYAGECSAGPLTIGGTTYKQAITCSKSCPGGNGCNNKGYFLQFMLMKFDQTMLNNPPYSGKHSRITSEQCCLN